MRDAVLLGGSRYPGEEVEILRHRIAGLHMVTPEQVVLGCGSSEILRMAAEACAGSRKKVIVALPTFDSMSSYASQAGAEVVAVPLSHDYSHDVGAMIDRSDARTGLVYICNPNNPTGTLTGRQDIEALLDKLPRDAFVLIDEAYHHYVGGSSDYASFIDRPLGDSRVVVSRSFSKIHGLAGLRVGYAIAAAPTAQRFEARRLSESVNVVAAIAAVTALDEVEYARTSARRNTDDRQEFLNQANARMLRTIDSQTNFVMLSVGHRAVETVAHFRTHAVLIAPPVPGFDTHVRVSLGTPEEMREFWRVWDLMPVHAMSM
jgi:histidinol-phosphate aminotransferase